MRNSLRPLVLVFALALALAASMGASAQTPDFFADTVVGPIAFPRVTVVGAGETCQDAKDNAAASLREDYLVLSISYGQCFCADITDPFTGEYMTTLCSVKASAWVFRRAIPIS